MYDRLWTLLPGPLAVRIALVALLAVAVTVLLMGVVFPGVEALLPPSDVTFP